MDSYEIEKEIEKIKLRNQKVELDKSWGKNKGGK